MVAQRPPNRAHPLESSSLPSGTITLGTPDACVVPEPAGSALANRRLLHLRSRAVLVARGHGAFAVIRHRQATHQRLLDALLHRRQSLDLLVGLAQLDAEGFVQRAAERAAILERQPQLLDLLEREAQALRLADVADRPHRVVAVFAPAVLRLRRPLEQSAALVEADRLDVHVRFLCQLSDGPAAHVCLLMNGTPPLRHEGSVDSVPWYGVNPFFRGRGIPAAEDAAARQVRYLGNGWWRSGSRQEAPDDMRRRMFTQVAARPPSCAEKDTPADLRALPAHRVTRRSVRPRREIG